MKNLFLQKKNVVRLFLLLVLALPQHTAHAQTPASCWNLVWKDEFNTNNLDTNKWTPEVYRANFNGELEYYTARPQNLNVANGNLNLIGLAENYNGANYTSARINTSAHFNFLYGRAEARIQIPATQGIWPAFWLLPKNGGWPDDGEIDVMEILGHQPNTVYSTLHALDTTNNAHIYTGNAHIKPAGSFSNGFHYFATEWSPDTVRFFIDSMLVSTITKNNFGINGKRWPFNTNRFYLILNLAIGGYWPGNPNATTIFPAQMKIDWVRVHQKNNNIRISGKKVVYPYTPNEPYTAPDIQGANYTWSLPTGATIASTTNNIIKINWGNSTTSGWVKANITTPCGMTKDSIWVDISNNLLDNYSFEDNFINWTMGASGGAAATRYITSNAQHLSKAAVVNATKIGSNFWDVQLRRSNVALQSGVSYTLKFWAKSSLPNATISTSFINSTNYTNYAYKAHTLSNTWTQYTHTFTSPVTAADILMTLDMGNAIGTYYYDNFSLETTASLSVNWLHFEAKTQNKSVLINFGTATETNNDYFEIQHATDGSTFETIAQIKGNGTSNIPHDYRYLHQNIAAGTHFYRLKQVDIDGKYSFSAIVKTTLEQTLLPIVVYPNPAQDIIYIYNQTHQEPLSITLYDVLGNVIFWQNYMGLGTFSIDAQQYARGIYFIKISGENYQLNQRLMIK